MKTKKVYVPIIIEYGTRYTTQAINIGVFKDKINALHAVVQAIISGEWIQYSSEDCEINNFIYKDEVLIKEDIPGNIFKVCKHIKTEDDLNNFCKSMPEDSGYLDSWIYRIDELASM